MKMAESNIHHQPKEKRKILILAANPSTMPWLRFDQEIRDIEEGMKLSKNRGQFEIISSTALRLRDLRRALLDTEPEIVHFIGHGEEEGLFLEDNRGVAAFLSREALAELFKLFANKLECVVLSACHAAMQADAVGESIRYVIGMRGKMKDKAAIEFAVGFYDALGGGRSIADAFSFGKIAILSMDPNFPEELMPILKIKN